MRFLWIAFSWKGWHKKDISVFFQASHFVCWLSCLCFICHPTESMRQLFKNRWVDNKVSIVVLFHVMTLAMTLSCAHLLRWCWLRVHKDIPQYIWSQSKFKWRQWCGIIHYHWWTASIKPRLLFSRAGYASWGLSLSSVKYYLLQLLFSACVAAVC